MTKEELEKEAWQYADKVCGWDKTQIFDYLVEAYLASAEPREKRIATLEKEIAELDCQKNRNKFCYSCANATERCFRNEIGCPCEKYKSYKDENAELKDKIEMYDFFYEGNGFKRRGLNNSIQIAEYIKKLELRLSYAKETIEGLMRFCRCFAQHHTEDIRYKEAEQFLKDCEVEK